MKGFPKKLRVGIQKNLDFFHFNITGNGTVIPYGGFEFELMQIYGQFLGADLEYAIARDDSTWGMRLANNSWSGLFGLAYRKEVDLIMGGLFAREERGLIGDPTNPYAMEEIHFVTKLPDFQPKTFVFVEPFLFEVWILIVLCLIFVSMALFLIHGRKFTFLDQFFSMFALLLQQSAEVKPRDSFANRIPFASWTLIAQLLSLSYMSVLLSFMTVPKREPIVDTVEKLLAAVDKGLLKVATPRDLPLYLNWLETSENPSKRKLGKYVKDNDWHTNFDAHSTINALLNKFAVMLPNLGKRLFTRGRVATIQETFYTGGLVIYTAKGFCCREALNLIMSRAYASGIFIKISNHYEFEQKLHLEESQLDEIPEEIKILTLEDLSGCFLLLIIGMITSSFFFLFELIWSSIITKLTKSVSKVSCWTAQSSSRIDGELEDLSLQMKVDLWNPWSINVEPVVQNSQHNEAISTVNVNTKIETEGNKNNEVN